MDDGSQKGRSRRKKDDKKSLAEPGFWFKKIGIDPKLLMNFRRLETLESAPIRSPVPEFHTIFYRITFASLSITAGAAKGTSLTSNTLPFK